MNNLRKLAEAASHLDHNESSEWDSVYFLETYLTYAKNARFVNAATPTVILSLLDKLQAAEAELEKAQQHIKHIGNDALRTENAQLRAELAAILEQETIAWMGVRHGMKHFTSSWSIAESEPGLYTSELVPRTTPGAQGGKT